MTSQRDFVIRSAEPEDVQFMTEMLVAAVNWNPLRQLTKEEILRRHQLGHYIVDWPRPGDMGIIGEFEHPVGAAWIREFSHDDPGYGFVAPEIPELTLAVAEGWRGQGCGRKLLRGLIARARTAGVRHISLSVERGNQAQRLYVSEGFRVWHRGQDSDTMLLDLT